MIVHYTVTALRDLEDVSARRAVYSMVAHASGGTPDEILHGKPASSPKIRAAAAAMEMLYLESDTHDDPIQQWLSDADFFTALCGLLRDAGVNLGLESNQHVAFFEIVDAVRASPHTFTIEELPQLSLRHETEEDA